MNAHVDETLFGSKPRAKASADVEIAIVGKDTVQVRKLQKKGGQPVKNDAVVIPASELNRLKDNATLLTKEEEMERKARAAQAYEERMKKSEDRTEKMMQMEEERKKNALLSDFEKDERAQK